MPGSKHMEVSFKTDQYSTSIAGFVRHLLFTINQAIKSADIYIEKTTSWNPKHPVFNGCLVISNHFLCKDFESSN